MSRSLALFFSTAVLGALPFHFRCMGQTDTAWTYSDSTDDGVTVSSREVAGSGIRELRAHCAVGVPPDKVFHAAMRRETYRHTSSYVVDFRVTRTEDPNVWYTYQRLSFPLVHDRDYALRYEARNDSLAQGYAIVWTIANDHAPPPEDDVVRVQASHGALEMIPEGDGKRTRLVCTLYADPGGIIPDWLTNIANRTTVPDLLRAIRDQSLIPQDSSMTNP